MTAPLNPYAAPKATLQDEMPSTDSAADARRRELIRHETLLKSVGSLYYFLGVVSLMALISSSSLFFQDEAVPLQLVGLVFVLAAVAVLYLAAGYGFRRLRPWVRIPGALLSVLGLISFPVGTLVGIYILYLMFGQKGRQVLALDYQNVIAATPHIKYQRTLGDRIALGFVILIIVGFGVLLVVMLRTG